MDLMVQKYRFGKERFIKKINDIWEFNENNSGVRRKNVMSKKSQGLQHRGGNRKQALFCQVMIKTMLLSIIYLLSYLSKGVSEVKDR